MLGAAQADALGAERAGAPRILGNVGVCAHAERAHLVGPTQDGLEVGIHLGIDQVPFVQQRVADADRRGREVDVEAAGSAHAGAAHATGDQRSVRGLATLAGQDALGCKEARDILGFGERTYEHNVLVGLGRGHRRVRAEHNPALGGAGRGGDAARQHLVGRVAVKGRMQQRVERRGVDRRDGLRLRQQLLVDRVHGKANGRLRRPLGVARLQHVQAPLLDRELGVLDVAVVALQVAQDRGQRRVRLRHDLAQLGELLGVAHP